MIRIAKIEDCQAVYELTKNTPELVNPSTEPPPLEWIESFVKEKQIFYVAVENNEIIGYIMGERTIGDIGLMWMLTVKKEFRGRGVGKNLLLEAEEECKNRNLKAIVAYGFSESKSVLSMLDNHGYHKGNLYYEFVKTL
jgi:ribosomal protein S18 acetylase RimI-like enzyme